LVASGSTINACIYYALGIKAVKNIKTLLKSLDDLSKIKAPHKLFSFIEDKLAPSFKVTYFDIFGLNDSETKYTRIKSITAMDGGPEGLNLTSFNLDDPVVVDLLDSQKAISIEEVDKNLAVALTKERRTFLLSLSKKLRELETQVCIPGFADNQLLVVFILGKKMSGEGFLADELGLLSLLAKKSAEIIHNFNLLKEETKLFIQSIRDMNKRLEFKDFYTRGHSHRVGEFSVIMGGKLQSELDKIPYGEIILYYAAEFHDVGKINMPDNILKKEDALNDEEYAEIKKHPIESVKILKPMEKWFGKTMLDAVLYHHENYDGTGYPHGKKGEEISILAKIIRVADSFDAMVTNRPYRKALVQHQVLLELKNGSMKQYDPRVIDAFLEAYKEGLFTDIFSQIASMSKDQT